MPRETCEPRILWDDGSQPRFLAGKKPEPAKLRQPAESTVEFLVSATRRQPTKGIGSGQDTNLGTPPEGVSTLEEAPVSTRLVGRCPAVGPVEDSGRKTSLISGPPPRHLSPGSDISDTEKMVRETNIFQAVSLSSSVTSAWYYVRAA